MSILGFGLLPEMFLSNDEWTNCCVLLDGANAWLARGLFFLNLSRVWLATLTILLSKLEVDFESANYNISFKLKVCRISFCISFSCSISMLMVSSRFEVDWILFMNCFSSDSNLLIFLCLRLIRFNYIFLLSSFSPAVPALWDLLSTDTAPLCVSALAFN